MSQSFENTTEVEGISMSGMLRHWSSVGVMRPQMRGPHGLSEYPRQLCLSEGLFGLASI